MLQSQRFYQNGDDIFTLKGEQQKKLHFLRGQHVLLDSHLALAGV